MIFLEISADSDDGYNLLHFLQYYFEERNFMVKLLHFAREAKTF